MGNCKFSAGSELVTFPHYEAAIKRVFYKIWGNPYNDVAMAD
jgi:hypothetical protein